MTTTPIEDTDTLQALDFTPELECESEHAAPDLGCTIRAEYWVISTCNRATTPVCEMRIRTLLHVEIPDDWSCEYCGRLLAECWRYIPIGGGNE